jgi:hypothetical protein
MNILFIYIYIYIDDILEYMKCIHQNLHNVCVDLYFDKIIKQLNIGFHFL